MVAFTIGSINIYRYGIFYLVTFILGYLFLWWIGKSRMYANFDNAQRILTRWVDDIVLATVIGILIGGRLGEVLLYNREYFSQNPAEIFAIRHGGMSFIGGIVWVVLAILVLDRIFKLSRKEFLIVLDLILVIVPVGIILWRFGNFLNQELYGIVAPSWWPTFLTHTYSEIDNLPRVNTNMLAMLLEWVLIFFVVVGKFIKQYVTRRVHPGSITVTFAILYSIVRFVLEYFREDSQSQFFGPFTTTQWFMIFLFLFGIALWRFVIRKR